MDTTLDSGDPGPPRPHELASMDREETRRPALKAEVVHLMCDGEMAPVLVPDNELRGELRALRVRGGTAELSDDVRRTWVRTDRVGRRRGALIVDAEGVMVSLLHPGVSLVLGPLSGSCVGNARAGSGVRSEIR